MSFVLIHEELLLNEVLFHVTHSFHDDIIYGATLGLLMLKYKKPTKRPQHRQNVEPEQLEDFSATEVRLTLLNDSL